MEKVHKKSALMSKTKEQLSVLIMMLEHNNNVLHETLDIQAANYIKLTSWTPVSERLPEADENVLTCDKYGNRHLFTYYKNGKYPFGIGENHPTLEVPIAWMPLPERYKEGK